MPQPSGHSVLLQDLARIEATAVRPAFSAGQLAQNLKDTYRAIFDLDLERYDAVAVKSIAPAVMTRLFDLRMKLRNQIADWKLRGLMSLDVQKMLRDVFRATRYATDMLGELAIGYDRLPKDAKTRRAFTGTDTNTLVNSKFETGEHLPFRSGDLLLMRGQAHNSAAIARIGDVDSQFSHVGIIHVDDKGKHWIVEALIEIGSTIEPLEQVLHDGLARAVVLRHKDAELAARAAKMIHDHIKKTLSWRGRPILYDFSMKLEPYDTLYCSKLIRQAFDMASNGKIKLPAYTTRLDMKNRDFLDRIGVETTETFAPGDVEIDPDFDLVAEWQDYRVTSGLRMQDLTMDKFFAWMDEYGYRFKEDFVIRLIGFFGRLSSVLSNRAKKAIENAVPTVPRNMRMKTVATIAMLHQTAEPVKHALEAMELERIQKAGRPLHPREVLDYLEHRRQISNGKIGYLVAAA